MKINKDYHDILLKKKEDDQIKTVFDRLNIQMPQCGFGQLGLCCHLCNMGPCRINPFSTEDAKGVCGADSDMIVSWNLLKTVASGAAAHIFHGYHSIEALKYYIEKKQIKDKNKARQIAGKVGINKKRIDSVLKNLVKIAKEDFTRFEDEDMIFLKGFIDPRTFKLLKKLDVLPGNPFKEISEAMHKISIGVDSSYINLLNQFFKISLADLFAGSLIATEFQDIMYGTPEEVEIYSDFGIIKEDEVNIVIHGHSPIFANQIINISKSESILELLKKSGAKGFNIMGMCCSGNELLMRQGIPLLGSILMQEYAILTGTIELMVVDVQCIFPSVTDVASCYHTEVITTFNEARIPGATHVDLKLNSANQTNKIKMLLKKAINNFKLRNKEKIYIPDKKTKLIAGYSIETILDKAGNDINNLIDLIKNGKIRGVVALVGCSNPKMDDIDLHVEVAKYLLKNDILIVTTGCAAHSLANNGFLSREAADYCSENLAETCRALKIPPCLHMGSCVDNSRIFKMITELSKVLEVPISSLPIAGAAMEWMSEKAISIGAYFIVLGVMIVLGIIPPILSSKNVTRYLCKDMEKITGGKFVFQNDPVIAGEMIVKHINKKRTLLGI